MRPLRNFFFAALILFAFPAWGQQQPPPTTAYPAGWQPYGAQVSVTATPSGAAIQLGWVAAALGITPQPIPPSAWVCNDGTVATTVAFGPTSVAAIAQLSVNGSVIPGNASGGIPPCKLMAINPAASQYMAASAASTSPVVTVETGTGNPGVAASGGAGGGGAVCTVASPCLPSVGGTGVSNANTNTLTLVQPSAIGIGDSVQSISGVPSALTANQSWTSSCLAVKTNQTAASLYVTLAATGTISLQRYADSACAYPIGAAVPSAALALSTGICATGYCGRDLANDGPLVGGYPVVGLEITITDTSGASNAVNQVVLTTGVD